MLRRLRAGAAIWPLFATFGCSAQPDVQRLSPSGQYQAAIYIDPSPNGDRTYRIVAAGGPGFFATQTIGTILGPSGTACRSAVRIDWLRDDVLRIRYRGVTALPNSLNLTSITHSGTYFPPSVQFFGKSFQVDAQPASAGSGGPC